MQNAPFASGTGRIAKNVKGKKNHVVILEKEGEWMQNDKLLPCPMCGGEMELVNVEHSPLLLRNCVFKCKKGCIESVHSFNTEEEAIKACNTRKPIERIVEQLECMQKYNSEQAEIYHNVEKPNAYTREMKDLYIDRANCYGVAIRTVKGGVDNAE